MSAASVLVVGPGPMRPGVSSAASVVAADFAGSLARGGRRVVVLDADPASALFTCADVARRYLEPLRAETLRAIATAERIDAIAVDVCGRTTLAGLGTMTDGTPTRWLLGAPGELTHAAVLDVADGGHEGPGVDLVVACDGRTARVVAAFAASVRWDLALADATHTSIAEASRELVALVEGLAARAPWVGIATVRCDAAGRARVLDRCDGALWPASEVASGVVVGELLARLALGDATSTALESARRRAGRRVVRTPAFDFAPYPGVDRAPSATPKSLGAVLASEEPSPGAKLEPIVLLGPGPARAGHGAEAAAAVRLAAREATRTGREVVVLSTRELTGAEREGALVVHGGTEAHLATLGSKTVLAGFGAPTARVALDVSEKALALDASLQGVHGDRGDAEVHVVLLSDGSGAHVVGTFEHVERAGVHPDDAAAVFPALGVDAGAILACEERATELVSGLGARGIVTVRFAVGASQRAIGVRVGVTSHALSLGLALGRDLVAEALRLAIGGALTAEAASTPRHVAVEEHVFAFSTFQASDTKLDASRRSTGTVLALGEDTARAYARALAAMGASFARPPAGEARVVVLGGPEEQAAPLADVGRRLYALGFEVVATEAAAAWLGRLRVPHRTLGDARSLLGGGAVAAVIATGAGDVELRRAALGARVTCFTTVELARLAVRALEIEAPAPRALEDYV